MELDDQLREIAKQAVEAELRRREDEAHTPSRHLDTQPRDGGKFAAKWTPARLEDAIAKIRQLGSVDAAAAAIGCRPTSIAHAFKQAGLPAPSTYKTLAMPPKKLEPVDKSVDKGAEPVPAPKTVVVKSAPYVYSKFVVPFAGKSIVVTCDTHVPYSDPVFQHSICDYANDAKPDAWYDLGDFLDLLELSRFSAGSLSKLEGRRIATTWTAGNRLLDLRRDAAGPQCTNWKLLQGNHEKRIEAWLSHADNGVFAGDDSVSIERRLNLDERGVEYLPGYPDNFIREGHVALVHGRFSGKYHAQRHLDWYKHSVVYGHVHNMQTAVSSCLNGQQIAQSLGFGGDPDSEAFDYGSAKLSNWVQGFGVLYVNKDGSFIIQPIQAFNGQFTVNNKTYGQYTRRK